MRITGKSLQVSFEHDVIIGNAIEATLVHMAFIGPHKGEIHVDLDFADITDVKFMGVPIGNEYDTYKKFKASMMDLGIDVAKLFDEKAAQLITDENIETLKQMYRDTTGDL